MMIVVMIYYWIDHLLADQIWLCRNQADKAEVKTVLELTWACE